MTASSIGDRAHVEVVVEVAPQVERKNTANILVAVVEDGLVTNVERGENRNRTLSHSAVARSLTAIGSLPLDTASRSVSADLPLSPEWRTPRLRVAAFVQERGTLRILGSAATRWAHGLGQ